LKADYLLMVIDHDEEIVVHAALTGMDKENLNVSITENM
jgi:HSP20 family molecular chaperone IbpA